MRTAFHSRADQWIEAAMQECNVEDVVELARDIPELAIYRGTKGIIQSIWFLPMAAYEVEFDTAGTAVRALVMAENLIPTNEPPPKQR